MVALTFSLTELLFDSYKSSIIKMNLTLPGYFVLLRHRWTVLHFPRSPAARQPEPIWPSSSSRTRGPAPGLEWQWARAGPKSSRCWRKRNISSWKWTYWTYDDWYDGKKLFLLFLRLNKVPRLVSMCVLFFVKAAGFCCGAKKEFFWADENEQL